MSRIALILLLLIDIAARGQTSVGLNTASQRLNKDSLRWVLMSHPDDTNKIATLILLAHQFGNAQPDSAISYFQEAGRLSRQLGFTRYDPLGEALINGPAIRRRTWVIIAVVGVLLLAALSLASFLYYRQRQLMSRQASEMLQIREENVRLKASLETQVNEQHRISLEMRNNIASELASLLSLSRTSGWAGDPATTLKMQQTAEQLVWQTDEIAWMLDHRGNNLRSLVASIRDNATRLLQRANIDLRFDAGDDIPDVSVTREFRRDVYLIVKEAVQNTIRHSEAGVVEISIHTDARELTIVVRDNGKGLYRAGGSHLGNGMKEMQLRVEQIDGRMEITAGAGTAITIVSPLPGLS